jgi:hypothetical protein
VHGADWLANPLTSLALIAASLAMLFIAISLKKKRPVQKFNIIVRGFGHRVVKTSDTWLLVTGFLGLAALGAHFMAEYWLHLYDVTPIDRFTHGLSGMAVTAIVLIFNLTNRRRVYYPASIGASWAAFILWEVYEWILVTTVPDSHVEVNPADTAIDLWIDTLGALAVCFFHDEFVHDEEEKKAEAAPEG